jgi:hypothetical protein
MDRIVPALGALDYCIPGPNPDWQNGLDANFQTFISSIAGGVNQEGAAAANIGKSLGSAAGALGIGAASAAITGALGAAVGSALPIVGTIIGGLIGSLIGGLFTHDTTTYSAQPSIYDKTTNDSFTISPLIYRLGINSVPQEEFLPPLQQTLTNLKTYLSSTYSTDKIRAMFVGAAGGSSATTVVSQGTGLTCSSIDSGNYNDCCVTSTANFRSCLNYCGSRSGINDTINDSGIFTPTNSTLDAQCDVNPPQNSITTVVTNPGNNAQAYAQGFVDDALAETKNLPSYNLGVTELDQQYETQKDDTRTAIAELESIKAEVDSLVGTAKARYIAEQAQKGTPVNQACIDAAYDIDTTPIVGDPTKESPIADPMIQRSNAAKLYFYTHL